MAKRQTSKQSLLTKALRDNRILNQEVLMYQRMMEVMRQENSFEDILKLLVTSVTQGLGFDRAGIFLADPDRKVIERVIGIDRNGNYEGKGLEYPLVSGRLGLGYGFSNLINGFEKASYTNNTRRKLGKHIAENTLDPGVLCNAVVPITVGSNKAIGVLAVDNLFTQRRLGKADLLSLTNFATQAGLVLESFRLHEKIRDLTIKDGLTGVYNRRYFDNYLPREVQRCRRYHRDLGMLYVDLDRFKRINDIYGHPAGDAVLQHVAKALLSGLRNVDIVVRLGGDEFAVILPEVGTAGLKVVAERLLLSIVNGPVPVERMRENREGIGASIGMASLREDVEDYKDLIKLADKNLYHAKTSGRNCVSDGGPLPYKPIRLAQ